ncbi:MAG TPA: hypothetical protein PLN21_13965 [Gemmatales bacterium]|nr:hypothetical protein [Gemmatales bacterium]
MINFIRDPKGQGWWAFVTCLTDLPNDFLAAARKLNVTAKNIKFLYVVSGPKASEWMQVHQIPGVSPLLADNLIYRKAPDGAVFGMEQGMDTSKMSQTMKQQLFQKQMGDITKDLEMLTNMMKSIHEMQMAPVRNMRG